MRILSRTLATVVIATASIGAFAGELYDPTAGQPTSTVSQTGLTASDARYVIIDNNEIVFAENPAYTADQPRIEVAGLTDEERRKLYSNS